MAHPQFTAKTLHCIECPLRPPTGHIVTENAAICTNGRNGETGFCDVAPSERRHWAVIAN